MQVQHLLIQRPMEPFNNSIALGASHKGRGKGQPEELKLFLEIVRVILAAVIRAQKQTSSLADVLSPRAVGLFYRHSQRFHCRKAVSALAGVPGHDLIVKVVYNPEKPAPAFLPGKDLL